MENSQKPYGLTDDKATEDLFGIGNYIDALSEFILKCDTPMTISIQGTWGTGKTSIMNIVDEKLTNDIDKKIISIWFNAWQFSQFAMNADITSSLLTYMVDALKPEEKEEIVKFAKVLKIAGVIGARVAFSAIQKTTGIDNLECDAIKADIKELEDNSSIRAVEGFKDEFSKCVKKTLERDKAERIVVFIDDLDRLEPQKAVELLEVLKLFLDCKQCVFILAIDYDVVVQGVAKKYGIDIISNKKNEEIGRNFFDKIIQVPFKVPVAHYDIKKYIRENLAKINIIKNEEENIDIYEKLIRRSIGTNPRRMKRIFNAFLLLDLIVKGDMAGDEKSKQLLFAILCLQHYDEDLYNYIVRNIEKLNADFIVKLGYEEDIDLNELPDFDLEIDRIQEAKLLLMTIVDVIKDKKCKITDKEYERFVHAVNLSAVTSTVNDNKAGGSVDVLDSAELNFQNMDLKRINEIVDMLKTAGENAVVKMKNRNSGKGVILGWNKKTPFAEIYSRANGFRIELRVNSKGDLTKTLPEEIKFIENDDEWKIAGNKINHTVKVDNREENEKIKTVIDYAYRSWE